MEVSYLCNEIARPLPPEKTKIRIMMKIQLRGIGLMMMLLLSAMTMQAMTLKGVVTDKTNKEPLIGATVQINGSITGGITDLDGKFELSGVKKGIYTLVISYISYRTAQIQVQVSGNSPELNVELMPDNQ